MAFLIQVLILADSRRVDNIAQDITVPVSTEQVSGVLVSGVGQYMHGAEVWFGVGDVLGESRAVAQELIRDVLDTGHSQFVVEIDQRRVALAQSQIRQDLLCGDPCMEAVIVDVFASLLGPIVFGR